MSIYKCIDWYQAIFSALWLVGSKTRYGSAKEKHQTKKAPNKIILFKEMHSSKNRTIIYERYLV